MCPDGCFLKWWYPPNTPKWSFFVREWWLLGTTILGNPQMVSMKFRICLMFVCFGDVPFDVFCSSTCLYMAQFHHQKSLKKHVNVNHHLFQTSHISWHILMPWIHWRLEGHQHPPPQKSITIPIQNRSLCGIAQIVEAKTGSCFWVVAHQFSRFSFT